MNFADPFGLCAIPPCPPVRPGMFMGAALNGVGQAASNPSVQNGAFLLATTFAPEALVVDEAITLYRFARGTEKMSKLIRDSERAEASGQFPYGVSTTTNPNKRLQGSPGPGAAKSEAEAAGLQVRQTGPADHFTVSPPNRTWTQELTDVFNRLFRGAP